MDKAVELFHSNSYAKAERLFLELGDSAPSDALKYLYLISKKLNRPNQLERYNKYLKSVGSIEDYKSFLAFRKSYTAVLDFNNKIFYIKALWSEGEVDRFVLEAKELCLEVIQRRLYSKAQQLHDEISKRNSLLLFNRFFYLQYLMDIEDFQKAKDQVRETMTLILSNWKKIRSQSTDQIHALKKLLNITDGSYGASAALEEQRLILKREIAFVEKASLDKNFLMEYLITFKDDAKELINLINHGLIPIWAQDIKQYIKSNEKLKAQLKELPRSYRLDVDETIIPKVKLAPRELTQKIDLELEKPSADLVAREPSEKLSIEKTLSLSEKEIISQIESEDKNIIDADIKSLVQSLIGVGFYQAALKLIDIEKDTEGFEYLKCFCLFELEKFEELVSYSKIIIEKQAQLGEDSVPFLYFRGQANLRLEKWMESIKDFEQILKLVQEFRNTKELLENAKAQ